MKKIFGKYLMLIVALIAVIAVVVPVAAYEGHLVDVKAHLQLDTAWFCEHGTTRTPGWWQTHLDASDYVLTEYLGSSIDMGWPGEITNIEDLMGVFWASQTHNTDGTKRDKLCKAKAQASFQVLAAILNSACPNGAPLPVSMDDIRAIMSGDDEAAVKALHDQMAAFNLSGDYDFLLLGLPGDLENNATPGLAQEIAHEEFADCD